MHIIIFVHIDSLREVPFDYGFIFVKFSNIPNFWKKLFYKKNA